MSSLESEVPGGAKAGERRRGREDGRGNEERMRTGSEERRERGKERGGGVR
jgi:hypothetical protein